MHVLVKGREKRSRIKRKQLSNSYIVKKQLWLKEKRQKKRKVKIDADGLAFIQATFNNIIISVCNKAGEVISWASAGKAAFDTGMRTAEVYVKGPGAGREAAIRALDATGIKVLKITDLTPIPHNGCRPPKHRRV